jgi:hypothetical protein
MITTYYLIDPVPYQPTRQYTEFVEFEVEDGESEDELPSKVKYSNILQEEEYEEDDGDFFPIK